MQKVVGKTVRFIVKFGRVHSSNRRSFYDRYDCRWGRADPRVRAVGFQVRQIPRHPTSLCGQPEYRPRLCDRRV